MKFKEKEVKHEIKRYIITHANSVDRKMSTIAALFGVAEDYVCRCFSELNISPRKRPENYVG